jgi:predicted thioredoxin/glutaredoxin
VRLAHDIALASGNVVADMVDATTYGELAGRYRVMGVPASFFDGRLSQVGAAPEERVVDLVLQADRLYRASQP